MSNFNPLTSAIGGVLIGASASALLALDGKVAGSVLATMTFMATGIATVYVVRHVFGGAS